MITDILILIILIVLSAFFSASEVALLSLSRLKIEHLVRKKKPGIEIVQKLKKKPHDLLVTILIGNNIVNIGASTFATTVAMDLFKNNVVSITTFAMTFLILTFGEIMPKSFAMKHNVGFSIFASKPLYFLSIIFYPIIKFYDLFSPKYKKKKPIITEDEIKSYVSVGKKYGQIKESERQLIHRIFKFDDVTAEDIMTRRLDMVILNANDRLRDHIEFFIKLPHTRIPVYKKEKDNIIGVIHMKDVLRVIHSKKYNVKLKSLIKPVLFIPETRKIDVLLREFQLKNKHMAIVIEDKEVIGLVTLEDVLEEIVGEIEDETDIISIKQLKKNKWEVSGRADLKQVNKKLKIKLKKHQKFETFGGFILHELDKVPEYGQVVKIKGLRIKVIRKTGRHILDTVVWK